MQGGGKFLQYICTRQDFYPLFEELPQEKTTL